MDQADCQTAHSPSSCSVLPNYYNFFFPIQLVPAYAVLGVCVSVGILILVRVRGNERKKKKDHLTRLHRNISLNLIDCGFVPVMV